MIPSYHQKIRNSSFIVGDVKIFNTYVDSQFFIKTILYLFCSITLKTKQLNKHVTNQNFVLQAVCFGKPVGKPAPAPKALPEAIFEALSEIVTRVFFGPQMIEKTVDAISVVGELLQNIVLFSAAI